MSKIVVDTNVYIYHLDHSSKYNTYATEISNL